MHIGSLEEFVMVFLICTWTFLASLWTFSYPSTATSSPWNETWTACCATSRRIAIASTLTWSDGPWT